MDTSVITVIEMHASFLAAIITLFINMHSSSRRSNRKVDNSLNYVYICCILMVITDCLWTVLSSITKTDDIIAYAVNLIYFVSSSSASVCWFVFTLNQLDLKLAKSKKLRVSALIIYDVMLLLYLISPWTGTIFSINNGEYVRGNLFFLDPVIKMGYIGMASAFAIISGKKKKLAYMRKSDYNLSLFGVPVLICGILQIILGVSFNCLGITVSLVLIYITGITNQDRANTDAIYSLANSFEASYIVNLDTGIIRPLRQDIMHDENLRGMKSNDYTEHFKGALSQILLPEDKESTLDAFDINNVSKRLNISNSFSVRYRVKEKSGHTALHMAIFIRAIGNKEKREFLLGFHTISADSLIYERNEGLNRENQKLEQINLGIIESVAKIVEARDGESGGHIVRVKKLTEILAREIMKDYPEYEFDEERIKLISSASVLHDVGKIVIPDAILLKPERLTEEEFTVMKTHTTKGCDILNLFPLGLDDAFLECALGICRWHHEKYDGNGYPDGLVGDDIPISAQIVSVADCFDALVSERPYKKAFTPDKAFEMIFGGECGNFSPKILSALEKQKGKLSELSRLYR